MRHIAAHYVFDGNSLHKYALITLDESNSFVSLTTMPLQETAGVEFYSGIIAPLFFPYIMNEDLGSPLKQLLHVSSMQGLSVSCLAPWVTSFCQEKPCSIFLLENIDLPALTLTENTKIRRLL